MNEPEATGNETKAPCKGTLRKGMVWPPEKKVAKKKRCKYRGTPSSEDVSLSPTLSQLRKDLQEHDIEARAALTEMHNIAMGLADCRSFQSYANEPLPTTPVERLYALQAKLQIAADRLQTFLDTQSQLEMGLQVRREARRYEWQDDVKEALEEIREAASDIEKKITQDD